MENEAPPRLCSFLYNLPLVFAFCRNLFEGRGLVYAKDGGKRGVPCGLSLQALGKGFSPAGRVNCEQSYGKGLKEVSGEKERRDTGDWGRSPEGHRGALRIPKAAGLKSTSPPKYSI